MRYVDEFRNPQKAKALLREIEKLIARIDICRHRPLALMEVCGGHTHTIFKFGVETLLPDAVELVHGPGCPVCVLPMGRVDDCVALAETPGVIFTTFGDAMRVPGSKKSLLQAKGGGAARRPHGVLGRRLRRLLSVRRHPAPYGDEHGMTALQSNMSVAAPLRRRGS